MYFVGGLQTLVRQGIGGLGHGIRELPDAGDVVVKDVSSHNIVQGIFRDLIHPTERESLSERYYEYHAELTKPSRLPIPRRGHQLPRFAGNAPFLHPSGDL